MSSFAHKPVMVEEVLDAMRPRAGGRYVDGSIGGAGHARAILDASGPNGWLHGFDRDGAALEAAAGRLAEFEGRYSLRRANFAELADWVEPGSCDGVLFDLGVSSPQLDRAERGFSFQQDGPLDMRMDDRQTLTAAELVNSLPVEDLARIFWEYGGEGDSRRLARAIAMDRQARRFETTRQLAGLIERISPRGGRKAHPATRVFQALRIEVNDELNSLRRGLEAAQRVLRPGGRLCVITFQSLEDRVVKAFGRERTRDYEIDGEVDVPELRREVEPAMKWVERKGVRPGPGELEDNPRSRSAHMRVLEKL